MVRMLNEEIQTREVLGWKGLHLLHYHISSCSQKLRVYLNLKGLDWTSHPVDIPSGENYGTWYMGINPRGLVPTLVHDGAVIIESNDILEYLEERFPDPAMIPSGMKGEALHRLAEENDLHLDLRALSARYLFPLEAATKPPDVLAAYEKTGSGTVGGQADRHKGVEVAYFNDVREHGGISDARAGAAAERFGTAYREIEARLTESRFLLGDAISVLDIAWYVYSARLLACGYPLHDAHPRVGAWFNGLNGRDDFSREVQIPPPLKQIAAGRQAAMTAAGRSLGDIAVNIGAAHA